MIHNKLVFINGEDEMSRNFFYTDYTIKVNLLTVVSNESVADEAYNVTTGGGGEP
jgi:hypothetical protein